MSKTRIAIGALTLSATAFVGMLASEGYSERAYPDPTRGAALPTIGFGTTEGVKMGDSIDPVAAAQRALKDVTRFEGALKACIKVPLTQAEYDLYADLAYNIGPTAFCSSTLAKRLNAGDHTGACGAILMWRMSNGQDCSAPGNRACAGLWKRRLEAHSKCVEAQ